MTNIYAERSGKRCLLVAKGHATGSEQVCAAVSALVYALAGYLTNAIRERYIEFYREQLESGDVVMDFNGDDCTAAAFETVVIGLQQIAQQYPEFICVEYREE